MSQAIVVLKRFGKRFGHWLLLAYFACLLFGVWAQFFLVTPGKFHEQTGNIVRAVIVIVTALGLAGWAIRTQSLVWALLSTLNAILLLVGWFGFWYLSSGNRANWTPQLTRLDALQVSLGTLTTVGAPGITPRSQFARAVMTTQVAVDILAAFVLFGLLVARLAEGRKTPGTSSEHTELEPHFSQGEPERHERHRVATAIVLFGLMVSARRAETGHRRGSYPHADAQDLRRHSVDTGE